ncbi:neurofilament medium polypeptide [Thunnus thynnus]|uniref:neurofilament medium polypeptide n=1 Tax=Thunnus thynnus TaxID=8237 RepID=UPI003529C3ED
MSLGLPTSIQSSTVTLEDVQALAQEPELPPAEVAPVVAPPSLKEVQQAMQEASEQVEGRGAEEVLKELLERVVEAALGQVEGGSEGKADEATVQEGVEEDALGAEKGETEANTVAEVLEQTVEEEVEGEDTDAKGGVAGVEEEQGVAETDASEDAAEEGNGVGEGEAETAVGSVEETTAGVETGSREAVGAEVTGESLDTEVSQEVVEETVAALVETGGDSAVEEAWVEANNEQVVLSEEKAEAEAETEEAEETQAAVEVVVGGGPEQETVVESDPSLGVGDVEQIEDAWGMGETLEEETQVDETEGEVLILPSDNYEIETTQTVVGEAVEEEEINILKDAEGQKVEDEEGHLVVEGGATEEAEAVGAEMGEAAGGERDEESVIKKESEALVNEGGDQQDGEEEQITPETSHGSEKEDHDVLVISAPEPEDGAEASIEQSPENQAPTPSPSLDGVETGENTLLGGETSDHDSEIITPTDDLLTHDPVVVQPTLDDFVKDVLAVPPQAEREEPGEANELVEDTAGTTETRELGLEAWKIGAISAAVFLVLETLVIIIYILKCRKKNGTLALQRACEEGCVEPEAATGGDCSDDTLPAGNGDTQQIALDPSDVASTMAQNKEQQEEEHATAMLDLLPSSTEESANTGPGPDSSQDLRTSIL